MRLIDADVLIKRFHNGKADTKTEKLMNSTVRRMIREQPTAYDIDKVMEQLEEEWELSSADFDRYVDEVCPCLDAEYDDYFYVGLERAAKIVKAGGTNEM